MEPGAGAREKSRDDAPAHVGRGVRGVGEPEHWPGRLHRRRAQRDDVAEQRERLAGDRRAARGERNAGADDVEPLKPGAVFSRGLEADAPVLLRDPHGGAHLVERSALATAHRWRRHGEEISSEVGFLDLTDRARDRRCGTLCGESHRQREQDDECSHAIVSVPGRPTCGRAASEGVVQRYG